MKPCDVVSTRSALWNPQPYTNDRWLGLHHSAHASHLAKDEGFHRVAMAVRGNGGEQSRDNHSRLHAGQVTVIAAAAAAAAVAP
eukprot:CAMPEP_0195080874 /NCGR_PEP_ID=MMETSP0448-20130528/22471_1 /TAXON_ID=66468 /ORGANISM="Heterocapsa triquestra, Strain CCMP 448" /LENGTH=83 /DNA_ID=CAMNT_0040113855 /DNA_START=278 /DNA_END=525 /DNA_ORIENTATION=+